MIVDYLTTYTDLIESTDDFDSDLDCVYNLVKEYPFRWF